MEQTPLEIIVNEKEMQAEIWNLNPTVSWSKSAPLRKIPIKRGRERFCQLRMALWRGWTHQMAYLCRADRCAPWHLSHRSCSDFVRKVANLPHWSKKWMDSATKLLVLGKVLGESSMVLTLWSWPGDLSRWPIPPSFELFMVLNLFSKIKLIIGFGLWGPFKAKFEYLCNKI